jgi:hypothetical protein
LDFSDLDPILLIPASKEPQITGMQSIWELRYLYWVQNLRGHLVELAVGNGESMSRLWSWAKRATVTF